MPKGYMDRERSGIPALEVETQGFSNELLHPSGFLKLAGTKQKHASLRFVMRDDHAVQPSLAPHLNS